jgi:hypothetical protein
MDLTLQGMNNETELISNFTRYMFHSMDVYVENNAFDNNVDIEEEYFLWIGQALDLSVVWYEFSETDLSIDQIDELLGATIPYCQHQGIPIPRTVKEMLQTYGLVLEATMQDTFYDRFEECMTRKSADRVNHPL